jgi:hypothetical protein
MVLERVATPRLPSPLPPLRIVTAADIRADGRCLAVRCVVGGWEWRLPEGTPAEEFERVFADAPARLELAAERQGEALAYAADGAALWTISEGPRPTLFRSLAVVPADGSAKQDISAPVREQPAGGGIRRGGVDKPGPTAKK